MITARTTLGSPVYASPEVPHALATLRVTSQVATGLLDVVVCALADRESL